MPRTTTNDRARRRLRLLELLEGGLEATQEEIVERLRAEGFGATQATVSRDLDDIGAVRGHAHGRSVYRLPERNGPPDGLGRRVFSEIVRDVVVSANLVVVRTYPGMGAAVGAVIDGADVVGVLGCVAGDDTVVVVADEATGGRAVASRIKELAS